MIAAVAFTSCGKTPTPTGPLFELHFIGFEEATLDDNGVQLNKTYTEQGVTFVHNYTVNEGYEDYWNGFAVSNNTDKETPGYQNLSVYADGGYGDSANFGIASLFGSAEITLPEGELRFFDYAYVNNATFPYLAISEGEDGADPHFVKGPFENGDWFKLTVTGFDASGQETASTQVYLADFRDGKNFIMSEWTKVSFALFGEVNKITFTLSSSDNGEYGMNTPAYFCIDDVAYREYYAFE